MPKQKKECKAAHKALIKAGLSGTAEEQIVSKEWFSLLGQNNKLRKALIQKKRQREKMAAESKFRKKKQINLQVIYLVGTNKEEALISQQRMPRNILKRYMQMKTDLTHILHSQR